MTGPLVEPAGVAERCVELFLVEHRRSTPLSREHLRRSLAQLGT
jgi:hypothetical protein